MKQVKNKYLPEQITLSDRILNQQAGTLALIRFLKKSGVNILNNTNFNNGRYNMLRIQYPNDNKIYKVMLVYKREFYMTFGKEFCSEGESGIGETLNNDDLKLANAEDIEYIYFIYRNAHIYKISRIDFIVNSHKRVNDFEGKETRSINIKHLERVGEIY